MRPRAGVAWLAAAAVTGLGVGVAGASSVSADTRPAAGTPATVSADALPTVQVDGVVWAQAVVANTVYAGGQFTTARPAGAAPGKSTTPRGNLLAYDIRTGVLSTSFKHALDGQVLGMATSPDHKRLYVTGDFRHVDGVSRSRIAAFDTATGRLVTTFAPRLDAEGRAVAATNGVVYAGGVFTSANGLARGRLAAFRASDGHLLAWNPSADAGVNALLVAPGGSGVVVGGRYTKLGVHNAYGLGLVDATTGGAKPFYAGQTVRDAGHDAAITSLSTDGKLVFGTGYVFGKGGNLEGAFAAEPSAGRLVWLEDCHGDSYSAVPLGGVLYVVGHAHFCGNVGGWPETVPRVFHRTIAFTTSAGGTVAHNTVPNYADFGGKPAPRLLDWFPDLALGTFTGQYQAAWSIATNGSYVVLGGEFPRVNGSPQQGLVRFAVSSLAPNKQGPLALPTAPTLTASADAGGTVAVSWTTTYDRDNQVLTYTVRRSGRTAPVATRVLGTLPWTLGSVDATDTGVPPGTYTYRVTVTDPFGNATSSAPVTVTVPSG